MPSAAAIIIKLLLGHHVAALQQQNDQPTKPQAEIGEVRLKRRLDSDDDGESYASLFTPEALPPHGLSGHNLFLVGDSNERKFLELLCKLYGAEVHTVKTATCKDQLLEFPLYNNPDRHVNPYPSASRFCHIPRFDMSVMTAFHNGVLTTAPHARWHSHYLANNRSGWIPILNGTSTVMSSVDLVCFWKSIVSSNLPQRPLKVVAQSSVWDTEAAEVFLLEMRGVAQMSQASLKAWGWNPSTQDPSSVLHAWGWRNHVESLLRALQNGFGLEKVYWRTNPNCPIDDDFVNSLSGAQAMEMRQMVDHGEGIWNAVELIDWRMHYRAATASDCNSVHYQTEGYKAYLDLLWESF
jgi:hypothetical protein